MPVPKASAVTSSLAEAAASGTLAVASRQILEIYTTTLVKVTRLSWRDFCCHHRRWWNFLCFRHVGCGSSCLLIYGTTSRIIYTKHAPHNVSQHPTTRTTTTTTTGNEDVFGLGFGRLTFAFQLALASLSHHVQLLLQCVCVCVG